MGKASLITGGAKKLIQLARKLKKKKPAKKPKPKKDAAAKPADRKNNRTKKEQADRDKRAAELRAARKEKAAAKKQQIQTKASGFKSKIAKTLGGVSILGGLGSMLGGGQGSESSPDGASGTIVGAPIPQESVSHKEDPTINITQFAAALNALMTSASQIKLEDNEEKASTLATIEIIEDIQIDEEGGYPFIAAGTMIPTKIAEIGILFDIVDTMRNDMNAISLRLDLQNKNLVAIKDALKEAIGLNIQTKRDNERRRDEEDVENKNKPTKAGFLKTSAQAGAAMVGVGMLATATRALKAATLGGLAMFADDIVDMVTPDPTVEEAAEPVYDEEMGDMIEAQMDNIDQMDAAEAEEETEIKEESDLLDTLEAGIEGYEKYFEDDLIAGSLGTAGLIATAGAVVATTAGAAAMAPVLAIAGAGLGAAALGVGVGNMIADNTQIDEKIGEAVEYMMGNESIEDVASDQEMNEKFGNKRGAALLGDLLGEGMFDLAEEPKEIIAAFKDIDTQQALWKLEDDYETMYGRTLDEALLDVVGDKGLESIDNFVTTNIINRKKKEKETGAVEEIKSFATSLMSAQEGQFLTPDMMQQLVAGDVPSEIIDILPEEVEGVPIETIVKNMPAILEGDIESILTSEITPPILDAVGNIETKITDIVQDSVGDEAAKIIPIVMNRIKKDPLVSTPTGSSGRSQLDSATPTFRSIDPFLGKESRT